MFESSKERNPGETSISDLPEILKLREEMCNAQVSPLYFLGNIVIKHNTIIDINVPLTVCEGL